VVVCLFAVRENILIKLEKMKNLEKMISEKSSGHEDQRSIEIRIAELRVLILKNSGTPFSSFRKKAEMPVNSYDLVFSNFST